jgi:hypothetical protein
MQRVLAVAVVVGTLMLSGAALASSASNPAFLGIMWTQGAPGACMVDGVVAGSPAEGADVRKNDIVLAFDGVMIPSCDLLTTLIVAHSPGEQARIDLERNGQHIITTATLSTRASVIHDLLVGHPIEGTATDYEDEHELDLHELAGHTTILAFADLTSCDGCAALIRHVADVAQQAGRGGAAPKIVAVTKGELSRLEALHLYLGVPLLVANDYFQHAALDEQSRVYFMVLDRHGEVRFVAPISPDDEAADAAIDDVLAAAGQAERRTNEKLPDR